jgi:hypothetical protein
MLLLALASRVLASLPAQMHARRDELMALLSLPPEILLQIIARLSIPSVLQLRLVSLKYCIRLSFVKILGSNDIPLIFVRYART